MFLWTLAVGALSVLQTETVHAAGITAVRRIPGLRARVGARDLPIIPTTCQDGCSPFQPFLTGATCPAAQCCTTAFDIGYADCFTCVGNATGATDFTIAQEYVDVLITSCLTEGFTIPVLTLPGQNPNRTLVSALPPGASTIPVFPAEGSIVRPSASRTTETRTQSATTASQSSLSQSVTTAQSNSLSQSGTSPPQSTATAPPSSSVPISSPSASPSSTAPPNAGVQLRLDPYVGLGFAAVLALLL
ncbi:hypothetical protein C8R45DRAFT_243268 [Mycena sanguinolenta]|nr:hypothetical protein C8R45DRAFT_243268 [Mycena sanguinolenta]